MKIVGTLRGVALVSLTLFLASHTNRAVAEDLTSFLRADGLQSGVVAIVGLPTGGAEQVVAIAKGTKLKVFFQSPDINEVTAVQTAARSQALLGNQIFADQSPADRIQLADNTADRIWVSETLAQKTSKAELLRAVRPRGSVRLGEATFAKPVPKGVDDWSHPYHGPDNNPQSEDQLVRGNFRTQFIGYPKFSPMPEQTVIAGGRIFKAMGHIAHKQNQNQQLNTLLCINAYNGSILWDRPNPPGFMIHRNTMIATDDALYLGDYESCKILDVTNGKVRDEIKIDPEITDGPVWKWMALQDDTLFALVGNTEVKVDTQKSDRRGLGHWPWGMWQGHDYDDPKTSFGFGRTFVAIDPKTKKLKWHYRDEDFLDARAICMKGDKLYAYAPEKFLLCLNAKTGKVIWKNSDKKMLEAIGANGRAQHYITGYATTCYMKCNDDHLFFAGPQREQLVVANTKDGSLAWTYPFGNLQLVLRDDALWAAGPQQSQSGVSLDYETGKVLGEFPARRACTRATGCVDSIFFRASGGTVRVLTDSNRAQHIDPMRPPCQDGVLVAGGHLYWGPWMCGCQLSLYGNIGLRPENAAAIDDTPALVRYPNFKTVAELKVADGDWVTFRGTNARNDIARGKLPTAVEEAWQLEVVKDALPTAPVAAGGMVFVADRTGTVQAFDASGKQLWQFITGGPIYYAPAIDRGRLYVGSADGRVYALEAKTGRPLWSYRVGLINDAWPYTINSSPSIPSRAEWWCKRELSMRLRASRITTARTWLLSTGRRVNWSPATTPAAR